MSLYLPVILVCYGSFVPPNGNSDFGDWKSRQNAALEISSGAWFSRSERHCIVTCHNGFMLSNGQSMISNRWDQSFVCDEFPRRLARMVVATAWRTDRACTEPPRVKVSSSRQLESRRVSKMLSTCPTSHQRRR
jgi:hypothetical protein